MQELFIKEEKEEEERVKKKMDKCPRYLKQWVLRCLPKKRKEMNKIAHVFLQIFSSSKERYVFKE
jgi:hypothetical protein